MQNNLRRYFFVLTRFGLRQRVLPFHQERHSWQVAQGAGWGCGCRHQSHRLDAGALLRQLSSQAWR